MIVAASRGPMVRMEQRLSRHKVVFFLRSQAALITHEEGAMNISESAPNVECEQLAQGLQSAVASTFRQLFSPHKPRKLQAEGSVVLADDSGISLASDGARQALAWND